MGLEDLLNMLSSFGSRPIEPSWTGPHNRGFNREQFENELFEQEFKGDPLGRSAHLAGHAFFDHTWRPNLPKHHVRKWYGTENYEPWSGTFDTNIQPQYDRPYFFNMPYNLDYDRHTSF